jgi:hypothetical protein
LLQCRRAANRSVLGETLVDRSNRRILDVLRRIEIRFAGPQPDDVFTLCFELRRTRSDSEGGRRLDRLYAGGESQDISLRFLRWRELYLRGGEGGLEERRKKTWLDGKAPFAGQEIILHSSMPLWNCNPKR